MCDASLGRCIAPCEAAAETRSYRGCEYWPVTALTAQLDRSAFTFAVVVANPHDHPVTVTITRGGDEIHRQVVDAGDAQAITLPWVEALQRPDRSAVVIDGAYRLHSSLPITVYQYSPLEYRNGTLFSETNDASLLLPTTALGTQYVVVSQPSGEAGTVRPGFVTIVATEDETVVDVTTTARVVAAGDTRVPALAPGASTSITLSRGETLQLVSEIPGVCERGEICATRDHDLTGTEIRASRPVEVLSGHSCAFVDAAHPTCDHLEESLLPVDAWGDSAIVVPSQPFRDEPHAVRIVSASDGNTLTFDPPTVHASVTIDRGEILEFETRVPFEVSGTDAIQVAQFIVGHSYAFPTGPSLGDPSMSVVVPTAQFRSEYQILTPGTYVRDMINIVAPAGTTIAVDGVGVAGFVPIGATGFSYARVQLLDPGAHSVVGDAPFGVVAYGFAEFTSYMVPGGLDLLVINEPI